MWRKNNLKFLKSIIMLLYIFLLLSGYYYTNISSELLLQASLCSTENSPIIPPLAWSHTFNRSYHDGFYSGLETSEGELVFVGHTRINTSLTEDGVILDDDFWLVKTDSTSNIIWEQSYGINTTDIGNSIIQTDDGNLIVAGYTYQHGSADGWLIKTDSKGEQLWNRTYGEIGEDVFNTIIKTSDGGFCVVGFTTSYDADFYDGWLMKTNNNGDILWSHTYGNSRWYEFESIVQTPDGGFLLVGVLASGLSAYPNEFWVLKTNSFGVAEWNLTLGTKWNDHAYSIVHTVDDGYAIAGRTRVDKPTESTDAWLVKLDTQGNIEWNHTYGGLENDRSQSLIQMEDGGYALLGTTDSFGAGSFDFWLVRTDSLGTILWSQTFGTIDNENGYKILNTQDNGLVLIGSTHGLGFDSLVYKIGGELISTSYTNAVFSSPFFLIIPLLLIYLHNKRSKKLLR